MSCTTPIHALNIYSCFVYISLITHQNLFTGKRCCREEEVGRRGAAGAAEAREGQAGDASSIRTGAKENKG
jgi:hypothetical protein